MALENLEIKDLGFAYKDKEVFSRLSFSLGRGQIVGLLGRNGAGKSTLFSLLSGLSPLQQGVVVADGICVASKGKLLAPSLRAQMGVVFQNPSLDKYLTAKENLFLSGRLYGMTRREIRKRGEKYLELVGLSKEAKKKISTFSGGMKRRLELVRAFLHGPQFLLMDEPSAGLDEAGVRDYWRILKALQKEHKTTVLLTTHRIDEAEHCDRLLVLHGGKLIADETPSTFRSRVELDQVRVKLKTGELFSKRLENGPQAVPGLVNEYGSDNIVSVEVHKPTLADAFLQATGETLS